MSLRILDAGPQASIQAGPRTGLRHLGVPNGGPADPLSAALANRCVGNPMHTPCLEIALGPVRVVFDAPVSFAIAGATAHIELDGARIAQHETCTASVGSILTTTSFEAGMRMYLCVSGGFAAELFLGSGSTYLPARRGGHEGRSLKAGDSVQFCKPSIRHDQRRTPTDLRFRLGGSFALRCVAGPDLDGEFDTLHERSFSITQRLDRMGIELSGDFPIRESESVRDSSAVFPGALQVPQAGKGFLLGVEGQTTGGYPHALQVIAADRHLLGQLRPGNQIIFLPRGIDEAADIATAKQAHVQKWVPEFAF